jgi:hypothetical protein
MAIMARGARKTAEAAAKGGMPSFVDVRLTAEDRAAFLEEDNDIDLLVPRMQTLCDAGYRWGCAWNGESQSYTVSLTCRDAGSPNSGLCMTSFAKDLLTAIQLALFKHDVVTEGIWVGAGSERFGTFG